MDTLWPHLTLSFSSMAASSAKRRLPLPTPSFLASSLRLTWGGAGEDYGDEAGAQGLSGGAGCKLTWRSWRADTSHRPFFFLSFRKRFFETTPLTSCRWGIISSTVNTCRGDDRWDFIPGELSDFTQDSQKFCWNRIKEETSELLLCGRTTDAL